MKSASVQSNIVAEAGRGSIVSIRKNSSILQKNDLVWKLIYASYAIICSCLVLGTLYYCTIYSDRASLSIQKEVFGYNIDLFKVNVDAAFDNLVANIVKIQKTSFTKERFNVNCEKFVHNSVSQSTGGIAFLLTPLLDSQREAYEYQLGNGDGKINIWNDNFNVSMPSNPNYLVVESSYFYNYNSKLNNNDYDSVIEYIGYDFLSSNQYVAKEFNIFNENPSATSLSITLVGGVPILGIANPDNYFDVIMFPIIFDNVTHYAIIYTDVNSFFSHVLPDKDKVLTIIAMRDEYQTVFATNINSNQESLIFDMKYLTNSANKKYFFNQTFSYSHTNVLHPVSVHFAALSEYSNKFSVLMLKDFLIVVGIVFVIGMVMSLFYSSKHMLSKNKEMKLRREAKAYYKLSIGHIGTAAEKVLTMLESLKQSPALSPEEVEEILFVITAVASNKLYEVNGIIPEGDEEGEDKVDDETRNWVLQHLMVKKEDGHGGGQNSNNRRESKNAFPSRKKRVSIQEPNVGGSGEHTNRNNKNNNNKTGEIGSDDNFMAYLINMIKKQQLQLQMQMQMQIHQSHQEHLLHLPSGAATPSFQVSNNSNHEGHLLLDINSNFNSTRDNNLNHTQIITVTGDANHNNQVGIGIEIQDKISSLLNNVNSWDFNIFALEEATKGHALFVMGNHLFRHHRLLQDFEIPEHCLNTFLEKCEAGYNDNPYHCATHAADVLQSFHALVTSTELISDLDRSKIFAGLLACVIHDFHHPGFNNNFMVETEHSIALLFNDISVLENYHIAESWKLFKSDEHDIFKNVSKEDQKKIRQTVIDMILATDMSRHADILGALQNRITSGEKLGTQGEDSKMILRLCIKLCDVSNPTKTFPVYNRWTRRVLFEFYEQGDMEKKLAFPAVSPFMDREKASVTASQIGFIKFVVQPLVEVWRNTFKNPAVMMKNVESNLNYWKDLQAKGINDPYDSPNLKRDKYLNNYFHIATHDPSISTSGMAPANMNFTSTFSSSKSFLL